MYHTNENPGMIDFTISSEMIHVDRVIGASREFLAKQGITHVAEANVVLRELLINAIEHGNHHDRGKTVNCQVAHLGGTRFQISVEDQGDGFDHFSLPSTPGSRGLPMVRGLCDGLEFNLAGNAATAYLTIINPTTFAVDQDGQITVICPSGDLNAGCAEELRATLMHALEAGRQRFRLDLSRVAEVDARPMAVLAAFSRLVRSRNGAIDTVNCSPDVARVLNLVRITAI